MDSIECRVSFDPVIIAYPGWQLKVDDLMKSFGLSIDPIHTTVNSLLLSDTYSDPSKITSSQLKKLLENLQRVSRNSAIIKFGGTTSSTPVPTTKKKGKKEIVEDAPDMTTPQSIAASEKLIDLIEEYQLRICSNPKSHSYSRHLDICSQVDGSENELIYFSGGGCEVFTNDNPITGKDIERMKKENSKKKTIFGVTIDVDDSTYDVHLVARNVFFRDEQFKRLGKNKTGDKVYEMDKVSPQFELLDVHDEGLDINKQLTTLINNIEPYRGEYNYPRSD